MKFSCPTTQTFVVEAALAVSANPCRRGFDARLRTENAHVLTGRHAR